MHAIEPDHLCIKTIFINHVHILCWSRVVLKLHCIYTIVIVPKMPDAIGYLTLFS